MFIIIIIIIIIDLVHRVVAAGDAARVEHQQAFVDLLETAGVVVSRHFVRAGSVGCRRRRRRRYEDHERLASRRSNPRQLPQPLPDRRRTRVVLAAEQSCGGGQSGWGSVTPKCSVPP